MLPFYFPLLPRLLQQLVNLSLAPVTSLCHAAVAKGHQHVSVYAGDPAAGDSEAASDASEDSSSSASSDQAASPAAATEAAVEVDSVKVRAGRVFKTQL